MSREEIQKLLGGYATDTLSEAQRSALFEAALEDQELFDALAKEQALRDVLQDPAARQHLIVALGPARTPFAQRVWRRLRQPVVLAVAGGVAALLIVAGLLVRETRHVARQEAMVADAIGPSPPAAASPSAIAPFAARPVVARPSVVSRRPAPPRSIPLKKVAPPVNGGDLKQLDRFADGGPRSATAAPAAPSPQAMATGAQSSNVETQRQIVPAAPAPVLSLNGPNTSAVAGVFRAKAAAAGTAGGAVAYTMLLKRADGTYAPAPSGTVLHAGDSVRLQIEPGENGYIYLLQFEAGRWSLVERMPVQKGTRYQLPSMGGLQSEVPATLELLVKFSTRELPEFANLQGSSVDALASNASARSSKITLEFR